MVGSDFSLLTYRCYESMLRVCLCYNQDSILLDERIKIFCEDKPYVQYESWNEEYYRELKKSRGVKSHFAARKTPFCGIYRNDNMIKGFYSEVGECTETQITNYLAEKFKEEEALNSKEMNNV